MYYWIVEVSYADLLLITKLIVLSIKLKVLRKTNFASNGIVKPTKKTRSDQCVLR